MGPNQLSVNKFNILKLLFTAILFGGMSNFVQAETLPCSANGLVSSGTETYNFTGGNFIHGNRYWSNNYYARVIKSVVSSVVDAKGNILERNIKFDLISESDTRGCDQELDWVKDSDFINLQQ